MILLATLGGIVALIFWGTADYLMGKGGRRSDVYLMNFLLQCTGSFLLLPFVLWFGISIPITDSLYVVAMIAALFTIASVSVIKAFTIGPYGVATPLANSYPLVTLFVGFSFFHFETSLNQLVALLTIIVGVIMLAIDRTTFDRQTFHGSVVYFAGIAAIFWGIGFALFETIIDDFTWLQFLFLLNVFLAVFGFLYYVIVRRTLPNIQEIRHTYRQYVPQIAVLSVIGSAAFFAASEHVGSVIIPAVVASSAPLVPSLLAYIHDNERLSLYKRFGALVVIAGLMLLNIL